MRIRAEYFRIVDLVRSYPQTEYFVFDPAKVENEKLKANLGKLHLKYFNDWRMYRSSSEMLKEGIRLLNRYYYKYMRYGRPSVDQACQEAVKLIECWGGLLGIRGTMEPYFEQSLQD